MWSGALLHSPLISVSALCSACKIILALVLAFGLIVGLGFEQLGPVLSIIFLGNQRAHFLGIVFNCLGAHFHIDTLTCRLCAQGRSPWLVLLVLRIRLHLQKG